MIVDTSFAASSAYYIDGFDSNGGKGNLDDGNLNELLMTIILNKLTEIVVVMMSMMSRRII